MPQLRIPPDDIADWLHVPVSADWDEFHRGIEMDKWILSNVAGNWYRRDSLTDISGFSALQRIYMFQDHGEGMMFAMRWT